MKSSFYEGDPWLSELSAIALPMLESWDFSLRETTAGFSQDDLAG